MASIAIRATRCSLSATSFKQLEVVDQIIKQTTIFGGRPKFMQVSFVTSILKASVKLTLSLSP